MMKKLILIIAFFAILTGLKLNAQYNSYVNLSFSNNIGNVNSGLVCGIRDNATNGLDTALGEEDYPGHPFQQFSVYFIFGDSVKYDGDTTWFWESYLCKKDFKPAKFENVFVDTFNLDLQWGPSDSITINWNFNNKDIIDSAVIQDKAGFVYRTNMFNTNSLVIDNYLVTKYSVIIYYRKDKLDISDNIQNDIRIFPNPAQEFLSVSSEKSYIFELFDNIGSKVLTGSTQNGDISLSGLSAGVYTLAFYDIYGNKSFTRVIKN